MESLWRTLRRVLFLLAAARAPVRALPVGAGSAQAGAPRPELRAFTSEPGLSFEQKLVYDAAHATLVAKGSYSFSRELRAVRLSLEASDHSSISVTRVGYRVEVAGTDHQGKKRPCVWFEAPMLASEAILMPPSAEFQKRELVDDVACDQFKFLPLHAEEGELLFWYCQGEGRRIQWLPAGGARLTAELSHWQEQREPSALPSISLSSSCQASASWVHMEERLSAETARRPLAGALEQLSQALAVGGMLPLHDAELIQRLTFPADGPFSPTLGGFFLKFSSTFPLQGRGTLAPRLGEKPGVQGTSHGVLWVDVANQRVALRSVAQHVSNGIDTAQVHTVYSGERNRLSSELVIGSFRQCVTLNTTGVLSSVRAVNPLSRAKLVDSHAPLPGKGSTGLLYSFQLGESTRERAERMRVDFLVNSSMGLLGISLHDLAQHSTTDLTVDQWTSGAPPEAEFSELEDCHEHTLEEPSSIAGWDFLRVFLGWHEPRPRTASGPVGRQSGLRTEP